MLSKILKSQKRIFPSLSFPNLVAVEYSVLYECFQLNICFLNVSLIMFSNSFDTSTFALYQILFFLIQLRKSLDMHVSFCALSNPLLHVVYLMHLLVDQLLAHNKCIIIEFFRYIFYSINFQLTYKCIFLVFVSSFTRCSTSCVTTSMNKNDIS